MKGEFQFVGVWCSYLLVSKEVTFHPIEDRKGRMELGDLAEKK
jgi:hypothetical protein